MDVLVEFCRTGELGPLRKGMTAAQVEQLLGPPEKIKLTQGEEHLRSYRYGNLSMTITCLDSEPPDKEHLRLRSVGVSFRRLPLELPGPIAVELTERWVSAQLDDVLAILRSAGVEATLEHDSVTPLDGHYQRFSAGRKSVGITAFDGTITQISG